MFEMEGIKLNIKSDAVLRIAEHAIERKSGARGLRSIVEKVMLSLMYEVPSRKDIAEVIIDAKVIDGKKKPVLNLKTEDKSA